MGGRWYGGDYRNSSDLIEIEILKLTIKSDLVNFKAFLGCKTGRHSDILTDGQSDQGG